MAKYTESDLEFERGVPRFAAEGRGDALRSPLGLCEKFHPIKRKNRQTSNCKTVCINHRHTGANYERRERVYLRWVCAHSCNGLFAGVASSVLIGAFYQLHKSVSARNDSHYTRERKKKANCTKSRPALPVPAANRQ